MMEIDEILQQIKNGILSNNLQEIADAYELITGEKLEVPKPRPLTLKEQLAVKAEERQIRKPAQSLQPNRTTKGTVKPLSRKPLRKMKGTVQAGDIQFISDVKIEDETELKEIQEERELIKKSANKFNKTSREYAELVLATCKLCGEEHEIPPSYLSTVDGVSYVCNDCTTEGRASSRNRDDDDFEIEESDE